MSVMVTKKFALKRTLVMPVDGGVQSVSALDFVGFFDGEIA